MHYDLGSQYVREKYILQHNLFGIDGYNQDEVFVQTTAKNRTIMSAMAQLQGIFEEDLTFPYVDDKFKYIHSPLESDSILHVTDDSCPRMGYIDEAIKNDPASSDMYDNFDSLLADDLFPRLRELTNMPDATDDEMKDVANYLYWAEWSNLELQFELTADDNDYIGVSNNDSKYKSRFANEELW